MMRKAVIVGIIYALLTPLNVWAGYSLATDEFLVAAIIIGVIAFGQIISTALWIQAQVEAHLNETKDRKY